MTMTDKEFLSLTEIEKKYINSTMEYYKHKFGMGGIEAFRMTLISFLVAKAFEGIGSAFRSYGDTIKKFSSALEVQIRAIRSVCDDGTRQIDNN